MNTRFPGRSLPSIDLVVLNSTQPYCGYQTDPYNHSTPKSIRKEILPNRILETSIYKRGWGWGVVYLQVSILAPGLHCSHFRKRNVYPLVFSRHFLFPRGQISFLFIKIGT